MYLNYNNSITVTMKVNAFVYMYKFEIYYEHTTTLVLKTRHLQSGSIPFALEKFNRCAQTDPGMVSPRFRISYGRCLPLSDFSSHLI